MARFCVEPLTRTACAIGGLRRFGSAKVCATCGRAKHKDPPKKSRSIHLVSKSAKSDVPGRDGSPRLRCARFILAAFPGKRSKKAVTTVRSGPASNCELWFGDYPIPHRRGSFWPGAETRLRNPPVDGRLQTLVEPGIAETVRGQSGAGEKPAGKRLASDKRHRADTNLKAKSLLPQDRGEGAGAGYCLMTSTGQFALSGEI